MTDLWPPPSDFRLMLQNPRVAFKDPDLKSCTIKVDSNQQPIVESGAFANVYHGTYQNGSRSGDVAIKVFSKSGDERQERYKAISDYLKSHPLKCLVDFEFLEKGILHGKSGKWYPIVRMEWVQGKVLFNWARARCESNDTNGLDSACGKWVELTHELTQNKIAHGDLQHANVMVTDRGELKLVDYDCMCVPSLVGRRNLEIGVEPYQHPKRNDNTTLFEGIDNFSALYIYVVLKALTAAPALWTKFVEPTDAPPYDKLLFRSTDFENPRGSKLFDELRQSPDTDVGKLADELAEFWRLPLEDIPALGSVVNDYGKVRELLSQKSFDEALELIDRGSGQPPDDLKPEIEDARKRVECRCELEDAIAAGNELEIKRRYRPQLLDDYPKAIPSVSIARLADKAIQALSQIHAKEAAADWRGFVQAWDQNSSVLNGRKSAESLVSDVQSWRQRNRICDAVLDALGRRPPDVPRLRESWDELLQLGGHPETATHKPAIEGLLERTNALELFRAVSGVVGESYDLAIKRAWSESLFRGWDEAEAERRRYEASCERVALVDSLRDHVRRSTQLLTITGEKAVVESRDQLPKDYELEDSLKQRADLASKRCVTLKSLQRAWKAIPLKDTALAEAWQNLLALHARELASGQEQQRLDLAVRRVPVLQALSRISLKLPVEQLDAALLPIWDEGLLTQYDSDPAFHCDEAASWKVPYENAKRRRDLLAQLTTALKVQDASRVSDLVEEPLLANYPFTPDVQAEIARQITIFRRAKELFNVLRSGQKERLWELFDQATIRQYADLFAPVRHVLVEWMPTEILPSKKLGFKITPASQPISIRDRTHRLFELQWTWPERRFVETCVVGICFGAVPARPDGDGAEGKVFKLGLFDRKSLEQGAGVLPVSAKAEWIGRPVVVWGKIDLGHQVFYSEPFQLGRLHL